MKKTPLKRKAKKPGARRKSVSALKKKLWTVFSQWVRLSHSNNEGYNSCFTCDRPLFWKESQAGHFISRRFNMTFVHEQNVHPQCGKCNLWLSGDQYNYGRRLDIKYGEGTADELLRLSKLDKKFDIFEIEEMIIDYKARVTKLLKQKGL
jgi:hypothetical protein